MQATAKECHCCVGEQRGSVGRRLRTRTSALDASAVGPALVLVRSVYNDAGLDDGTNLYY